VGQTDDIAELLREVRAALRENGAQGCVPWIRRALAARANDSPNDDGDRFARMEAEGWEG